LQEIFLSLCQGKLCHKNYVTIIIYELYKSPLPLTDPRDAVTHAHRVVHRCRRSVW